MYFSQNSYSEELLKLSQHLHPLETASAQSEDVEQQPPCFEKEVTDGANNLNTNTPRLQTLEFLENPLKEGNLNSPNYIVNMKSHQSLS